MIRTIMYEENNHLAYSDQGKMNGYTIIVQHGMIASISDYHLFNSLIESGFRLISIARPGYGKSSPYLMDNIVNWGKIVSYLIDALNISHFDVLGISSGAPYSYSIGFILPEKVKRIYILSGTPAINMDQIAKFWPYPIDKKAEIPELQTLSKELFFSGLKEQDYKRNDIVDSMMNNCFGIAQDLKLRVRDWGFQLSDLDIPVIMQHSRLDNQVPFVTAKMTSELFKKCKFIISETDVHFSINLLNNFINIIKNEYYSGI